MSMLKRSASPPAAVGYSGSAATPRPRKRLRHKHPLAIRWFHWINFPILFLMIWSGLLIYWSYDVYGIQYGLNRDESFVRFFPASWWEWIGWDHRLAEGMAFHFVLAWLFAINGLLYVGYTLVSGQWRYLVPNRRSFKEAMLVTLHDLHLRKQMPPIGKYNGAQQIAYTLVVLMGAGSLLTGLAIYKPVQFGWVAKLLGGYEWARWEHFWLTVGYVLFFLVHVAQVIRAGWNNFRGMVSGYEVVSEDHAQKEPADEHPARS